MECLLNHCHYNCSSHTPMPWLVFINYGKSLKTFCALSGLSAIEMFIIILSLSRLCIDLLSYTIIVYHNCIYVCVTILIGIVPLIANLLIICEDPALNSDNNVVVRYCIVLWEQNVNPFQVSYRLVKILNIYWLLSFLTIFITRLSQLLKWVASDFCLIACTF